MYMGHVAVGLAGKRVTPGVSVVALAIAAIAPDLGEIVLGLAHVPNAWFYTHTLPADLAWAAAAGAIGLVVYGRAGLVLAAVAATHVPLDYLTSRIGVFPDGPNIGLNLYHQPMIDLVMEVVTIVLGWWLYRSSVAAPRRNHASVIAIPIVMVLFQAIWDTMLS
jgi:hypothetical protein